MAVMDVATPAPNPDEGCAFVTTFREGLHFEVTNREGHDLRDATRISLETRREET